MCFGMEIGDGWLPLVEGVCKALTNYNDRTGDRIRFVQIKEKFGALRIYASHYSEGVDTILDMAFQESLYTCEVCGVNNDSVNRNSEGWIKTLCKDCRPDTK